MTYNIEDEKARFLEAYGLADLSASRREDAIRAAEVAFADTTPFTIKGHGRVSREGLAAMREGLVDRVLALLSQNPPGNQKEFDRIHHELCVKYVLEPYNNLLAEAGLHRQSFGKAQKMVNMLFKYLYCFDEAEAYDGWFEYAHMPLDNLVTERLRKAHAFSLGVTWTRLDEDEYRFLHNRIGAWLTNQAGTPESLPVRPLDAELIIWNEAKGI